MSIYDDAPITWDADTVCNAAKLNDEVRDKFTNIDNAFIAITPTTYSPAPTATITLVLSQIKDHRIQLPAGNITIDFSGGANGHKFLVRVKQDAVGGRTITWTQNANITWVTSDGNAPIPASGANKITILGFIQTGASTWDGLWVSEN